MGRQPKTRFGRIDWREMNREVDALLRPLGVSFTATTPVRGLSVADQQMVEIAKALSQDARVLIMDEPTASLSAREVERCSRSCGACASRASRSCSSRTGWTKWPRCRTASRSSGTAGMSSPRRPASFRPIRSSATWSAAGSIRSSRRRMQRSARSCSRCVELGRLGAFRDISFDLQQGEIVGLFGLVGAGRTEVARVIFGVDRAELRHDRAQRPADHDRRSDRRSRARHCLCAGGSPCAGPGDELPDRREHHPADPAPALPVHAGQIRRGRADRGRLLGAGSRSSRPGWISSFRRFPAATSRRSCSASGWRRTRRS